MNIPLLIAFGLVVIILILGGLTIFGLISTLIGAAGSTSSSQRLQAYAYIPDMLQQSSPTYRPDRFAQARLRLNNILSVFISQRLNEQLNSVYWPITTSEFALLRIMISLVLLLLGWWVGQSILPGVGLMLLGYLTPGLVLNRSIAKRRSDFEKQLVDVLVLMTGAVRAGYSLLQALSVVETEIKAPASEEIARVTREVELGRSLANALNAMSDRMENDDLQLVVTSININQQVGGNMATMLEAVTDTIRERQRLFGEIRAQTSQQRFTGFFLTLLPVIVGALLFVLNPSYMETLFDMMCIPIGALVGMVLGNIFVRQMLNFKV